MCSGVAPAAIRAVAWCQSTLDRAISSAGAGLTVKDGIYVTILAPERELMLDAARALQPFSTASP